MSMSPPTSRPCGYLPPYVVSKLLTAGDARLTRSMFETGRAEAAAVTRRLERPAALEGHASYTPPGKGRAVHDMDGCESPKPGRIVRGETDPATGDTCVDDAFRHAGTTYDFYRDVFGRRSLDGRGFPLVASVHYGQLVSNAFWDGAQMIYGDGDGEYFLPFTRSLGIVAHELAHGVMNFTANLAYHGQPGALNESFCDIMASLVVQWSNKQSVEAADWVMGADVLGPRMTVPGFRSFLADSLYEGDPLLGDDPQPKHMNGFVSTTEDYGGVHINSGIPNHAYYRAAVALGGNAWEKAGKIWFEGFGALGPQATFEDAAERTALAARRLLTDAEPVIRDAWAGVGVVVGS